MSFLGDFFKNYSQVALQSNAAKLNYDYSIKSAKNTPSATRQGLENAGYNPMLAVQNATSGANSSWTSAGQSQSNDLGNIISNAQNFQRLNNETNVAQSTEDMNYANADKAKAEANESVLRSEFIPEKMKSDIAVQNATAKKLENDIHIADETLKLNEKLGMLGIDVSKRGQDLQYNASTLTPSKYLIDKGESIYSSLGRPKTPYELGVGIAKYYHNRKR